MGEVRCLLKGVDLISPIWVENSKHRGGDLIILGYALSFCWYLWNFVCTFEAIVKEDGCWACYLKEHNNSQSTSFIGLLACSTITWWSCLALSLLLYFEGGDLGALIGWTYWRTWLNYLEVTTLCLTILSWWAQALMFYGITALRSQRIATSD